jgi:hypothetical protein
VALSDVLAQVLGFLRAGYPEGVPGPDQVPLFALLRRPLSDDEVAGILFTDNRIHKMSVTNRDLRVPAEP